MKNYGDRLGAQTKGLPVATDEAKACARRTEQRLRNAPMLKRRMVRLRGLGKVKGVDVLFAPVHNLCAGLVLRRN
jgi:hypothetical protein